MRWLQWLGRFLPSPTPRTEDHVSIWSVKARDARTFFRIVGAIWLVALARIGYNMSSQWATAPEHWWGVGDFALAVLGQFSDVGAGVAMAGMLLTRPVNVMGEIAMSVYQAMVNRYVLPVIEKHKAEGRAEGLVEGRIEGRAKGRTEEREEWLAWNRRRIDAENNGRIFDELPPGTTSRRKQ